MRYLSLLVRVFHDVSADKTRRRISQQEVFVCCNNLAKIIRQNYEPNLVVAIDTGGSILGELIAQTLGVPNQPPCGRKTAGKRVLHLVVHRSINIARRYNLDPIPLRWIMSIYHHFLFQTVNHVLSVKINIDVSGKKILVVDDTLHTGATVDVAVNYLRTAFKINDFWR